MFAYAASTYILKNYLVNGKKIVLIAGLPHFRFSYLLSNCFMDCNPQEDSRLFVWTVALKFYYFLHGDRNNSEPECKTRRKNFKNE